MLSDAERGWLGGLNPAGEVAFLGGRLLLRELAAELLDVEPHEVPLSVHCIDCGQPHGRPVLADTRLHVSLSRTAGMVVAAANWDSAVGIDVESAAVAPERLDAVESLTGIRSLQHWTRVEAVLKADGRGLRVDPGSVRVRPRGSSLDAAVLGSPVRYRMLDLAPDDGIVGSLAIAV